MRSAFFLVVFLILHYNHAKGQSIDSTKHSIEWLKDNTTDLRKTMWLSGDELEKYYNQHMLGLSLSFGGAAVSTCGFAFSKNGTLSPFVYVGFAITLTGVITEITGHRHIRNAGEILKFSGIEN